jgi:uncharacterized protein (UPF0212 family)
MDCRVVVEAAVPVYDVETADEAVRIAISKTGEMLNPDLNYVEIDMGERSCPHCGGELETAFIAADEGLVALELEMKVFNVEREEHASRIARKEIGQCLENIPLEVLEVEVIEDDEATGDDAADEESAADASDDGDSQGADSTEGDSTDGDSADDGSSAGAPGEDESSDAPDDGSDDEVLPEFEDLIE